MTDDVMMVIQGHINLEEIESFMNELDYILEMADSHFDSLEFEPDFFADSDWMMEYLEDGDIDEDGKGYVSYPVYIDGLEEDDYDDLIRFMNQLVHNCRYATGVSFE